MYDKVIKRSIDFLISFIGLIVLAPIFVLIVFAIKVTSKGPAIFTQKRVGRNKRYFSIYKFRTMKVETPNDAPTHLLADPYSYITPIGKFLRKTSLDELPQLVNILKGDMAIIGPRPALWNQTDLLQEREKYGANDIRPGLTGLAQINGRDELPIEEKARLDGVYTKQESFFTDCKCFFQTIMAIFKSSGVVEGEQTIKNNEATK